MPCPGVPQEMTASCAQGANSVRGRVTLPPQATVVLDGIVLGGQTVTTLRLTEESVSPDTTAQKVGELVLPEFNIFACLDIESFHEMD